MKSTDYYVAYKIINEADTEAVTIGGQPKVYLGENTYMCTVTIIEGYTKAEKETFERIIRISENGAEVEVQDWMPAPYNMSEKVAS